MVRTRPPPPPDLLAAFFGLRTANVALLDSLDEPAWQREAIHGEQGRENLARTLAKIAGHDLAHLNQLERTLAAGHVVGWSDPRA